MSRQIRTFLLFGVFSVFASGQQAKGPIHVLPSVTDPSITTFDIAHSAYFNPAAKSRNKLVVFVPGTNGDGSRGPTLFLKAASDLGFHVVSLSYPSSIAATVCHAQTDEKCFENFRQEIITGRDRSSLIDIDRPSSIENRLQKLLVYLKKTDASDGWGRYLSAKDEIIWDDLILSGMSQGGGHAPLMAMTHKVSRVVMLSAPKDYDVRNKRPAAWYGRGATPADRFYSFVHMQDHQGCDYVQQLEILKKMGLYEFGGPADVDKRAAPYNNSHILVTNTPGTDVTSITAHISVISDAVTPKDKGGSPLFLPVWAYMLTAH